MAANTLICLVMAVVAFPACFAAVTVEPLSVIYLPYEVNPKPKYELFSAAVEQIDYDHVGQMAYGIGGAGLIQVIDMADPSNARLVHTVPVAGVPNDLDVCGDYVALSVRDEFEPLPGTAAIFRVYDRTSGTMERLHDIPVGSSPASAVVFTKDCRTILIANEGEAGKDDLGNFIDPEGSVTIIKFETAHLDTSNYTVHNVDFRKYDARAEEYLARGVRWSYHGERTGVETRFSQDIEPEYIVLSPDESIAFVVLQENNAVAHIDIEKAEVTEIYPLGVKDWSKSGFDASDKDGMINIQNWPIKGLYQPDAIRMFRHGNRTLLVSANEGDAKKYKGKDDGITWTDKARGKDIAAAGLLGEDIPDDMVEALKDDTKLGRLYFSLSDGRDAETDQFNDLFTFGGRGFSIWDASDLSLVYDSGSDFEDKHAELMPTMFNNHVGSRKHTPEEDFDVRSDDNGPEVEIVETARFGGKTYFFIGNQRVSTMMIYSLEDGAKDIVPKFEGIHRAGGSNKTWFDLFDERNVGDLNFQDMRYITPELSPNGKPLLLVSGSLSGTFTIYEINFPVPANTNCTVSTMDVHGACVKPDLVPKKTEAAAWALSVTHS